MQLSACPPAVPTTAGHHRCQAHRALDHEMICLQNLAKKRVSEEFMTETAHSKRQDVIPSWVLMTLFISVASIENNKLFIVYQGSVFSKASTFFFLFNHCHPVR